MESGGKGKGSRCLDREKRACKIETDNIIVINYTVVWNVAIVI